MNGYRTSRRAVVTGGMFALAPPGLLWAKSTMSATGPVTVNTANGKLCGLHHGEVVRFLGVQYADDTGGVNRFRAPQPVKPWVGEREAYTFGDRAPQVRRDDPPQSGGGVPHYGEKCCVLNIFTPRLGPGSLLPVMVFVHGGGFRSGSGDAPIMEGSALASFGNAVVITVNRRLNVFGFANLGHLDPEFADAANAGQLDLIAALKWIQTNIEGFGGDRRRIFIFGHSGGGSAVETLAVMPGAAGLFHTAGNLSGTSGFAMNTAQEMAPVGDKFLANLSLGRGDLKKLRELPADKVIEAYDGAFRSLGKGDYRPVVDGRHIPDAPLTPAALARSSRIPTIMNCTSTEATAWLTQDRRNLGASLEQVQRRIAEQFGLDAATTSRVIEAYREQDSRRTPWDILVTVASDSLVRKPMRIAAQAKAAQGHAPIRLSEFAWQSSSEQGIWGGPHGVEIAFAFGNMDKNKLSEVSSPAIVATARNFMSALASFARTGTPHIHAVSAWKPYNAAQRPSMVFNSRCALIDDYRGADRTASELIPGQDAFKLVSGPLFRFDA